MSRKRKITDRQGMDSRHQESPVDGYAALPMGADGADMSGELAASQANGAPTSRASETAADAGADGTTAPGRAAEPEASMTSTDDGQTEGTATVKDADKSHAANDADGQGLETTVDGKTHGKRKRNTGVAAKAAKAAKAPKPSRKSGWRFADAPTDSEQLVVDFHVAATESGYRGSTDVPKAKAEADAAAERLRKAEEEILNLRNEARRTQLALECAQHTEALWQELIGRAEVGSMFQDILGKLPPDVRKPFEEAILADLPQDKARHYRKLLAQLGIIVPEPDAGTPADEGAAGTDGPDGLDGNNGQDGSHGIDDSNGPDGNGNGNGSDDNGNGPDGADGSDGTDDSNGPDAPPDHDRQDPDPYAHAPGA
jgi:hypothetical protein